VVVLPTPDPRAADSRDADSRDAPLIEARGLTKRFPGFVAVDGIDFSVDHGEAFGFLGPNGAGKTSTMRMVGCVSPISGGELRVLGMDPKTQGRAIRARLGVVPQEDTLDLELSVRQNLLIYARYFDIPRAEARSRTDELLDFVQLSDRGDARVDTLSGGMKRRLTIARALINNPEIVLLDEPTTGLDPQARHLVWERLYQLKRRGVTLVLTTHYMDEAEQLCDRLMIMDDGRIAAEGSPRDLIALHTSREVLELRFTNDDDQMKAFDYASTAPSDEGDGIVRVEKLADRIVIYTDDGDATFERLSAAGLHADSVLVRRATLEDVFLTLTGRQLEE
jgi:lipooligosaccharide transport system ATP-binding protein